ncbi:hypothetical protein BRUM_1567 [Bifidobacterium ruminantium]|uniref:Uncharacterized protein n=1 Tax=Bifidobacterium ruminantium TaxID=78346 RepID=A0A087D3X2_BIFRU|nr:hypothetical protein BRUM_1567 [Bifidobacterium ruminantium]
MNHALRTGGEPPTQSAKTAPRPTYRAPHAFREAGGRHHESAVPEKVTPSETLADHGLHRHHAHTGIRHTTHSLASCVGNHHRTRHATGLLSGISIM